MEIMQNLMAKKSQGAFRGPLNCPLCNAKGDKVSKWKYVENIGPFRIRYRCKDCKHTIQYDFSRSGLSKHPYAPYNNPHFRKVMKTYKKVNLPV